MRKRTQAREFALQLLYQLDLTKEDPGEAMVVYWTNQNKLPPEEIKQFTEALVSGTIKNLKEIDGIISAYATNWQIDRMAVVDRNILRMATYEIHYLDEIPPKVSINEAIDIAKKYGDKDSGKFVNGILDKINKEAHKDA